MVEQAIGWLSELKEREGDAMWLELVETLRTITEGKAGLEVFWTASCTHDMSDIPGNSSCTSYASPITLP